MNLSEYIALLESQLEMLKEAQQEAFDGGYYGDVAELNKQIRITGLWIFQARNEADKNESR